MECPLCIDEYPVNTGVICSCCGNRFCKSCYENITRYKCPNCRTTNKPFIIGEPPQQQPTRNHPRRCNGTYAGGRKSCTYQPDCKVDNLDYCSRCCKIRLGISRNSIVPNQYRT